MKGYELQFSNVINKALENVSEYVESRNSKLYKKINADAMVNINPNAFYQAIYQIIKNSCDSMPEGGDIFVTVDKEDDQIVIEVKDLGLGVPESVKQEIFEPFMTQGKENGVGLGLAVTKKIIEDHKGNITVESDLGEGSRFKIFLPIVDNIE
jgi:two-component system sporulation sensor kinase A